MTVERPWAKKTVTDSQVTVWAPGFNYHRDVQKDAENLARDLNTLFKEHVEWLGARASVQNAVELQCLLCHREYEEDENGPVCCDAAIRAWEQHQKELLA